METPKLYTEDGGLSRMGIQHMGDLLMVVQRNEYSCITTAIDFFQRLVDAHKERDEARARIAELEAEVARLQASATIKPLSDAPPSEPDADGFPAWAQALTDTVPAWEACPANAGGTLWQGDHKPGRPVMVHEHASYVAITIDIDGGEASAHLYTHRGEVNVAGAVRALLALDSVGFVSPDGGS